MKSLFLYFVALLASLSWATPITDIRAKANDLPRLVIYFQTTHDSLNRPISMLPLINQKRIALTHLIVCSIHINRGSVIHLNDYPPSDPRFYTLWNETAVIKKAGVKVMGMIGGAAPGSFDVYTLDGNETTFEWYYGELREVIQSFKLEGLDIDVEQPMSQNGITRLVARLRRDFGPDFLITTAPVASALNNGANLSGFNYKTLKNTFGSDLAWYNAQFYSGFGSMRTPRDFRNIVTNGFTPSEVVAGQLTSPANGGGYISYTDLNATVISLRDQYGQIGGVMGWEYFNSQPGGTAEPWKWAQVMTQILRPNAVPNLEITRSDAERLQTAYIESSMSAGNFRRAEEVKSEVDYMAMVNA